MNICVHCKHYVRKIENRACIGAWYNHRCGHEQLKRAPAIDPVTGETCFFARNDLGRVITTEDQLPYCRDINTDGNCELYEPKH